MELLRSVTGGTLGGIGYGSIGAGVGPAVATTGRLLLNLSPHYADHYDVTAAEAAVGGAFVCGALGVLHGLRPAATWEQVGRRVIATAAVAGALAAPVGAAILASAGHPDQLPLGEALWTQLCGFAPWAVAVACPVACCLGVLHAVYHRGHAAGVAQATPVRHSRLAAVPPGMLGVGPDRGGSSARTPLLSSAASDLEAGTSPGSQTPDGSGYDSEVAADTVP